MKLSRISGREGMACDEKEGVDSIEREERKKGKRQGEVKWLTRRNRNMKFTMLLSSNFTPIRLSSHCVRLEGNRSTYKILNICQPSSSHQRECFQRTGQCQYHVCVCNCFTIHRSPSASNSLLFTFGFYTRISLVYGFASHFLLKVICKHNLRPLSLKVEVSTPLLSL